MGVEWSKTSIAKFNRDEYFRLDTKFRFFADKQDYKVWLNNYSIELSNALTMINSPKLKKGGLNKNYQLVDLANIERKNNTLINVTSSNIIGSDKTLIKKGDIVIPKMEPKKGQFFLNISHQEFLGSTELIEYKINKSDFNPIFVYYLLVSPKVLKVLEYLESGKTHRRVNPSDLLKLKIPKISIEKQNKIANKIIPIEQEIKTFKESKKDILDTINEVFGEELGFDWEEFEKLKKQKIFISSLLEFSNNIDCRYSYKFHNKVSKFVYDFLISKTNKRIKDFISEPIVLGKSVSPKDYDENGEYFYIAMSNIKTWAFDKDGCKKVKKEYWSKNLNKTVQKDDIILARSGEGTIGKVALIEDEDIKAIFADFTQRIRLKNYNPRLAYYYFRSDLFQYLVYTHKKGLGNNTNIFPSQIQEFPIPDWMEEKQTEIVKKIKAKIDAQKDIDKQIEEKQNEISELIENAIKTANKT